MPVVDTMKAGFTDPPGPLAFAANGDLIGMAQRYGRFSVVVNADVISQDMAEDQGWKLFMALTGDQNPLEPIDGDGLATFAATAFSTCRWSRWPSPRYPARSI